MRWLTADRFLWKMLPDEKLRVYKWTGRNDYVALCEPEYISFGGGCVHAYSRSTPF